MTYTPYIVSFSKQQGVVQQGFDIRPDEFDLDYSNPLAGGLIFASLGHRPGGLMAFDSSLWRNDLPFYGMGSEDWIPALGRRALDFDGSNDACYKDVSQTFSLPLTLSIWANIRSISVPDSVLGVWATSGGSNAVSFAQLGSNTMVCYMQETGAGPYGMAGTNNNVDYGKWTHFCGTAVSTTSRSLYKNGKHDETDTETIDMIAVMDGLSYGCIYESGTPSGYSDCQLADAMIWNRILSLDEIAALASPHNVYLSGLIKRPPVMVRGFDKDPVRANDFEINTEHPLAQGLVFAGLGSGAGSDTYHDSSESRIVSLIDGADWERDIGRYSLNFVRADNDNIQLGGVAPKIATTELTLCNWIYLDNDDAWQRNYQWGLFNTDGTGSDFIFTNVTETAGGPTTWTSYIRCGWQNHEIVSDENAVVRKWTHLAHVRTSDNKWQMWVDGVLQADTETVGTSAALTFVGGGYEEFGAREGSSGHDLSGKAADLMAWSRALSAAEIKQLADKRNVNYSGLIQSKPKQVEGYRTYTIRPEKFTLDEGHRLAQGLVFAALGSSPGANFYEDSSPRRRHGFWATDANMVWSPEINRQAIDNTGITGDHLATGTWSVGTTLTLSCWIYWHGDTGNYECIFAKRDTWSSINMEWQWYFSAAGAMVWAGAAASSQSNFDGTQVTDTDQWTHLALTWTSGSVASIYKNGTYYGDTATAVTAGADPLAAVTVGSNAQDGEQVNGLLADVMAWSRPLSPDEIKSLANRDDPMLDNLIITSAPRRRAPRNTRIRRINGVSQRLIVPNYGNRRSRPEHFEVDYSHGLAKGLVFAQLGQHVNNGEIYDSSPNNYDFVVPDEWYWEQWEGRQSLRCFPAYEPDRIEIDNDTWTGYTVSGWFRMMGGFANIDVIFEFWLQDDKWFAGWRNSEDGNMIFRWKDTGGTSRTETWNAVPIGEWHHFTISLNAGGGTMYRDGLPATSQALGGFPLSVTTRHLNIGDTAELARKYVWDGNLADIMVWNRPLSAGEAQVLGQRENVMYDGLIKPIGSPRFFPGVDLDPVEPKANVTILSPSKVTQRPANFTLDNSHGLAKGLVFAGLGNAAGSSRCYDSSALKWHSPIISCDWSHENGRPCLITTDPGSYVNVIGNSDNTPYDFDYAMTAAIWCRVTSYDQYVGLWACDDPGSNWGLQLRGDTVVAMTGAGGTRDDLTVPTITDGDWHFFAGSYDGSTLTTYWDNVTGSGQAFSTDIGVTASQALHFGGTYWRTRYMTGAVADAMLWNRPLSAAEILQLADPTNIMYDDLIVPLGSQHIPSRNTRKRYWAGRDPDWSKAHNWAYGSHQEGGAGASDTTNDVIIE